MEVSHVLRLHSQDCRRAVRNKQFVPYFQPKVDLQTGRLTCVEVLARWNHPEYGLLSPVSFISHLEVEGLLGELTEDLLHQSLEEMKTNDCEGRTPGVAVNFTPELLSDTTTVHRLLALIREHRFCTSAITVEVTESSRIEDLFAVLESLSWLRNKGFKVSIDDFGTGYSSLKQLSQLPFTEMKIDRAFVSGATRSAKLRTILSSMIHLAQDLNLTTVAEGIEVKQEWDYLRSLGCTTGQGFYFGRPAPHIGYFRQSCCPVA